jgi:hypothetical protein
MRSIEHKQCCNSGMNDSRSQISQNRGNVPSVPKFPKFPPSFPKFHDQEIRRGQAGTPGEGTDEGKTVVSDTGSQPDGSSGYGWTNRSLLASQDLSCWCSYFFIDLYQVETKCERRRFSYRRTRLKRNRTRMTNTLCGPEPPFEVSDAWSEVYPMLQNPRRAILCTKTAR